MCAKFNLFVLCFQHDCQEFMALLLDSLHEQLKKWTESQKELEVSESTCTNLSPNIENERPQTPVSWASDEAATSENGVLVPIGKGISATQSKGINSANLPDVVFSQSRKQSGVSLRSNETVSKYKNAVRSSPHSKNPVHSGLKSQSTIRSKILGNCETKFKYQSKNTRLRGATTSLFQLPNFTPVGSASRVSNDKDISSTSSDTATSKWMDLKNSSSFGRFVSKNRKKVRWLVPLIIEFEFVVTNGCVFLHPLLNTLGRLLYRLLAVAFYFKLRHRSLTKTVICGLCLLSFNTICNRCILLLF